MTYQFDSKDAFAFAEQNPNSVSYTHLTLPPSDLV